jgi:hypothetical protein
MVTGKDLKDLAESVAAGVELFGSTQEFVVEYTKRRQAIKTALLEQYGALPWEGFLDLEFGPEAERLFFELKAWVNEQSGPLT